ncbi:hypothetical protein MELA_00174 [Candidatus Methylomirabilis lanthanidiphila]|uniref:Uncharacterized protein n=1 Tax=Candidatus Methylomirabilis lanthanidiphila TaxID=2211376 RepID=A0A564ZF93_9BACT|nr:hypothetical protein MELA_00174 [Candidatus Methylomirabilis lanthanidiphila]
MAIILKMRVKSSMAPSYVGGIIPKLGVGTDGGRCRS